MERNVFGPVPSRRLGISLGVNNIPHKVCSYSCLYCQIGKAVKMQKIRQEFYQPEQLVNEVEAALNNIHKNAKYPDYIAIVPDGEPTLDIHLGKLILKLKSFGIPVAVITNSSLIDNKDISAELMSADYISFKVDTVSQSSWKKINKPHKWLYLSSILNAINKFSKAYKGTLVTETMLIKGLNDTKEELIKLAQYLQIIKPKLSYIAIPTRPPAFENTFPANEATVALTYQIFISHGISTELLTGYEGNAFSSTGNFRDDILSITAVHPMRKDAVMELLVKSKETEESLTSLIDSGLMEKIIYNNQVYYLRKFNNSHELK
ncbi:MAG: radical SAM protein [Bacteroidota bacterium]